MYQYTYTATITIESEEPYSLEELDKMLEENMLAHIDSAPFNIKLSKVEPSTTNIMGRKWWSSE